MLKLCLLLAVAAAHRVNELEELDAVDESGDSKPKKGGAGINVLLVPGQEFGAMERPLLSHQMEIKPGAPDMLMDVQETGSGMKANGYEIEMVGPNGQLQVGYLRSKTPGLFSTSTKYEFRTASKKSILRMMIPAWGQGYGRKTAYVTSDVKKNPYTYYTFSKDGKHRMGVEWFSVLKGKSMGFDKPYLQAKGHFKGFAFQFYLAGQAEPVASMKMTDNKYNAWTGTKQRYRITMKSGVDPIMLSMLVGFIDSTNNGGGGGGGGGGGYNNGGYNNGGYNNGGYNNGGYNNGNNGGYNNGGYNNGGYNNGGNNNGGNNIGGNNIGGNNIGGYNNGGYNNGGNNVPYR